MKKRIIYGMFAAAFLLGTASSFVSCATDDYADEKAELLGEVSSDFGEVIKALEDAKRDLQGQIDELKRQLELCGTNCDAKWNGLNERIIYLEGKIKDIDDLKDSLEKLEGRLGGLEGRLGELEFTVENWYNINKDQLLQDVKKFLEDNKYVTEDDLLTEDDINSLIATWINANLNDLLKDNPEIKALIESYLSNYVTRQELTTELAKYVTGEDLTNALNTFLASEEFKTKVQEIIAEYGYLKESDLQDKLVELGYLTEEEIVNKIEEILTNKNYVTQEQLDDALDELKTELLNEINTKVNALNYEIRSLLRNLLASMITGIEINATENPIFGSASLPVDIRTTMLGAYYGRTANQISFPDKDLIKRLYNEHKISLAPEMWDAGDPLFEDTYGNAGKVYLTINPNTVDFKDQLVTLVTSQGNESPIKLAPVKYSDKELSFGYMRSGSDNGFYEAEAYLNADDINNVKVSVDLNGMKDAVKDVINQRSKSSVVTLAATLLNQASNALNMPAYAVKATWNENVDDADEATQHSVVSQYSIAATAVKPLSFEFMKGVSYDIPGIERLENFVGNAINRIFGQIKDLIPDLSDIGEIKLKEIELRDQTREALKIKITYTIKAGEFGGEINFPEEGIDIIDNEGNVIGHAYPDNITFENDEYTISFELDLSTKFDPMIEDMNNSLNFDELNDALAQLSELANLGSDLDGLRDKLKDGIFGYIDRLNNLFRKLTGSINSALQPCLLFTDANGNLHRVTTSTLGTQVKGTSIVLAPTSYTAELFAPAFKKFIAVTGVTGNATKTVKQINDENEDFGVVLPSYHSKTVTLKGLESGCTYEITYSALDYSGNICTKAYYISVK